jgi:hypothetical protein
MPGLPSAPGRCLPHPATRPPPPPHTHHHHHRHAPSSSRKAQRQAAVVTSIATSAPGGISASLRSSTKMTNRDMSSSAATVSGASSSWMRRTRPGLSEALRQSPSACSKALPSAARGGGARRWGRTAVWRGHVLAVGGRASGRRQWGLRQWGQPRRLAQPTSQLLACVRRCEALGLAQRGPSSGARSTGGGLGRGRGGLSARRGPRQRLLRLGLLRGRSPGLLLRWRPRVKRLPVGGRQLDGPALGCSSRAAAVDCAGSNPTAATRSNPGAATPTSTH